MSCNRFPLRIPFAALCCLFATQALALNFTDALALAWKNDPTFLGARANHLAAKERSNIAMSNLFPRLTASGNTSWNDRTYVTRGSPGSTDYEKFNSNNAQLNLTQPLWRHAEIIATTQADLIVQQNKMQVISAEQDLFVRFLRAWFDVMLARDTVSFTLKQSSAARQLRDQTRRATELGLASQPEYEGALARFEKANAELVAAQGDEGIKLSALEQIIGPMREFTPPFLASRYSPNGTPNQPLPYWTDLAERANPSVLAAELALQAAREEVRKQRAGHEPTVDIVGSYGRSAQGSGLTPAQRGFTNTQGTIGLQVSVPIYSGGGQSAKVAEAVALQEKTRQDLESAQRNARSAAKQAWFGVQAASARLQAANQAVRYGQMALQSAVSGEKRELKTSFDVFQAEQQLYSALRDQQGARHEVMLNLIKLKAAAGQVSEADLIALDSAFTHTPVKVE